MFLATYTSQYVRDIVKKNSGYHIHCFIRQYFRIERQLFWRDRHTSCVSLMMVMLCTECATYCGQKQIILKENPLQRE